MKIEIRGHSDDIIDISGNINAEFYFYIEDKPAIIACSDGTLLEIKLGDNNQSIWRISPLR